MSKPPQYSLRFLRWFCREDYLEEIEGNLLELYEQQAEISEKAAKRKFFFDVLLHFRPDYIRSFRDVLPTNHYAMFKNYFTITWRSLLKQKLYAFINISGLAVGLACFLLIFLYVQHEFSYDRFLPNSERIYRVIQQMEGASYRGTDHFAYTPAGLASTMKMEFPEVEQAAIFRDLEALISNNEKSFYEEGLYADQEFFQVFPYEFIAGSPELSLGKPKSIVLTRTLANKIYGQQNPVGQNITFRGDDEYTVRGVIQDLPSNSSIQFSFLVDIRSSRQFVSDIENDKWNNNDYYTFFTLAEEASSQDLAKKFPQFLKKYVERGPEYPFKDHLLIQPLSQLHFETNLNFDIGSKANSQYINLFSIVAILVLLLACTNYMNLAIARSIKRSNEVGVRKVSGAKRSQLIGQFLVESTFISCIALILALGLTYVLTPTFSYLLERPITLDLFENLYLIPCLVILVVLVGIISGSYPAFFMSSLNPIKVLKGKAKTRISGMKLQNWLMTGQYAISIMLIISSLVIYRQFQYIHQKELGYNKEHIVTISVFDREIRRNFEVLKEKWDSNPNILGFSNTSELPTDVTSGSLVRHVGQDQEDNLVIYRARVDYNYLDLFDLKLIAGRDFSPEIAADSGRGMTRIINRKAAEVLGWTPEEAIGKEIESGEGRFTYNITGVIEDFHMHSMHTAIAPLMLQRRGPYYDFIAIKISPQNIPETLSFLEKSIKQYSPYPFEYNFLDDRFDQLYKADQRLGEIFGFFTILSLIIASMGLFGLAAFSAQQRSKEIGIRKVLGASIGNVVGMMSKDFLRMVILGFVVAIFVAGYSMHQWLNDFAYHVELEWWVFLAGGLIAILIAFFTISSQSLKAAVANPVDSLRNE